MPAPKPCQDCSIQRVTGPAGRWIESNAASDSPSMRSDSFSQKNAPRTEGVSLFSIMLRLGAWDDQALPDLDLVRAA